MTLSPSTRHSESCPGCGAQLAFNPAAGLLSCPYCQQNITFAASPNPVLEQDFEQWSCHHQTTTTLSQTALEVECPGCNAQITFQPPDIAGSCSFCGTHITTQPHAVNPILMPEGILPFTIDQKQARQRLSKWLKTRWFAPDGLKQFAQHEKMQGVYLPFWTFDCQTLTRYVGERGTYYYITKTHRVKNDKGEWIDETYQERHTRWHNVSGQVQQFFDDLLIPGVTSVQATHLKRLAPWSLTCLVAYDPRFLTGFRAQRYQVNLEQGFELAKVDMQPKIDSAIRCDIGGDEQRIHTQSTSYRDKSFKHLLLPVWIATYRYQNKPYQVLINGETGKTVGDRPYSIVKIALAVGAGIVAVAAIWVIHTFLDSSSPPSTPSSPQPTVTTIPPSMSSVQLAPSSVPSVDSAELKWRAAINLAGQAALYTQTAQTPQAWQQVTQLWEQAINTLKQIPATHSRYDSAQLKSQEYQRNLNYARQQATQ